MENEMRSYVSWYNEHRPLRFHVAKSTVELWVNRAHGKRLDRVDWTDRSAGPKTPHNRVSVHVEHCVLELRKELKENSPLGE